MNKEIKITKSLDGFLKVYIPSIDVITWAKDIEDVKVAISEAIVINKILNG